MPAKQFGAISLTGISSALIATAVMPASDDGGATGLVREVREVTADFRDPAAAVAAGHASVGSCVSGPQEGALACISPTARSLATGPSMPR